MTPPVAKASRLFVAIVKIGMKSAASGRTSLDMIGLVTEQTRYNVSP